MKGRKWTAEEIDYLKKNAGKTTYIKIAEELDRAYSSVITKAKKLRPIDYSRSKFWTEEMDKKLLSMLAEYKYTYGDLAEIFGKSEGAINSRIQKIGTMMRPIRKDYPKDVKRKRGSA